MERFFKKGLVLIVKLSVISMCIVFCHCRAMEMVEHKQAVQKEFLGSFNHKQNTFKDVKNITWRRLESMMNAFAERHLEIEASQTLVEPQYISEQLALYELKRILHYAAHISGIQDAQQLEIMAPFSTEGGAPITVATQQKLYAALTHLYELMYAAQPALVEELYRWSDGRGDVDSDHARVFQECLDRWITHDMQVRIAARGSCCSVQ